MSGGSGKSGTAVVSVSSGDDSERVTAMGREFRVGNQVKLENTRPKRQSVSEESVRSVSRGYSTNRYFVRLPRRVLRLSFGARTDNDRYQEGENEDEYQKRTSPFEQQCNDGGRAPCVLW